MRKAWKGFKTLAGHTKPKLNSSNKLGDNNNREHIEHFWNLKVLYSVQFNSIKKNFNHPTRGNFVVVFLQLKNT